MLIRYRITNLSGDDRTVLPLPGPARLAVQVERPDLRQRTRLCVPTPLGHKNIQHTCRYTELAPDRLKNF
jgi:hypothetical protein